jgi:hypothetical protein
MKVIKVVALVAVAVAIVVFAAPLAGAIAGLGAGVASAAAVAAVTSSLYGIAATLALTALKTAFTKAPALNQSMADRLQSSVSPTAPRKIVFGETAAGNDIRFFETFGSKKDRYFQVTALASHRVNKIKTFTAETTLSWSDGAILNRGISSFRAVEEGTRANAQAGGSGAYWTNTSSFTGCAYLAIEWKLDNKILPNGLPQKTITVVEGCPLYDPRRDSANGGSGSHRPGDQNTWEYRTADGSVIGRNPALALLTYMIGWKINGKLVWGRGVPLNRINLDSFRAYANLCEEGVSVQGGGTIQRYTVDGIFSCSDTHETVMSALTTCMGSCKLNDVGGLYQLIGGYDDTAGPKMAFSESDLIGPVGSAMPYVWKPGQSIRDTTNIVRGRFADPSQQYQLADWGVIELDPEADGIPRTMDLSFGAVNRAETCQRIAKQFLLREKLTPGVFTANFGPRAFAVQVGSLITLSLPAQGWNNKLFRVQDQAETIDLMFQMTLREEDPQVFAWDREEKPLPANIGGGRYDPLDTISPRNFRLNTRIYESV